MKLPVVINHESENWNLRYRNTGRENGAATYSREIVQYQIPLWEKLLANSKYDSDKVIISTTPLLLDREYYGITDETQLVVQYLHRYPYDDPFIDVDNVTRALPGTNILFVVAYQQFCTLLNLSGYKAIYVPMTIDTAEVAKYARKCKNQGNKKIAYFGNLAHGKQKLYPIIRNQLLAKGYDIDVFANNMFNKCESLTQHQAWTRLSEYEYGIGVGRCALELYALGVKVLIIGGQFGGIVTNRREFESQQATNFNGRVITFDRSLDVCIRAIDISSICDSDIKAYLPQIEAEIVKALE